MRKKEVIGQIGPKNWGSFEKWMFGQTAGLNRDGTMDYYKNDVARFKRILKGHRETSLEWD